MQSKLVIHLIYHSPSKVKATVEAVKTRYPGRELVACLELHTYSSLSKDFLPLYHETLKDATYAFVYFNPHAVALKKLQPVSEEMVKDSFGGSNIRVYSNSADLFSSINELRLDNPVYLFMSSGDFDGYDIKTVLR